MHHNHQCRHDRSNISPVADHSEIIFKLMSTDLLLAAVLDIGDVDSSASSESEAPDDGKDVKVLPEAMSHTAAESIDDVTEEAMSHKSCSESKKGTHKKKGIPQCQGLANRPRKPRSKHFLS